MPQVRCCHASCPCGHTTGDVFRCGGSIQLCFLAPAISISNNRRNRRNRRTRESVSAQSPAISTCECASASASASACCACVCVCVCVCACVCVCVCVCVCMWASERAHTGAHTRGSFSRCSTGRKPRLTAIKPSWLIGPFSSRRCPICLENEANSGNYAMRFQCGQLFCGDFNVERLGFHREAWAPITDHRP